MYSVGDIFYEISIKTFEVQAYFIIRTPYNNIIEILLKVALNNITLTPSYKSVYVTISEFAAFKYKSWIYDKFVCFM